MSIFTHHGLRPADKDSASKARHPSKELRADRNSNDYAEVLFIPWYDGNVSAEPVQHHSYHGLFAIQRNFLISSSVHAKGLSGLRRKIKSLKLLSAQTELIRHGSVPHLVYTIMFYLARLLIVGDEIIVFVFP